MSLNLANLLWRSARTHAERLAVMDHGRSVTYDALVARAAAIAEAVIAAGGRPGDRAAILLERSADAIAALFGIHAAGLVAVVINTRYRARQIEHQLAHAGARLLLTTPAMLEKLTRPLKTDARLMDTAEVPAAGDHQPVPRSDSDFAQIIYTSGSSGMPKGVVFTHGAIHSGVTTVNSYLGQRADDRVASLLAMSTVYGLNQVLTATACGAAVVIETSPLAVDAINSFRAGSATVLAAVPPLWLQLLGTGLCNAETLPSLRILQNAGGHLPVDTVRRIRGAFPGAQLFLQYGQTETFRGTFLPPADVDRRPDCMGRAIPGADITVVREDGTIAGPGEVGELVHSGPTLASGYWNDPEATSRAFRPHPDRAKASSGVRAMYSGDQVRRDADGYFTFVSRADRLIKTMGFRVGPDEIADVIHASAMVNDVVVTSEPDTDRGERILAFVVMKDGAEPGSLLRYCRAELPTYMVPARIETLPQLPRLPSGKYDLAAIKAAER